MTPMEMKMERDLEYFRMKSAALDERDTQIQRIKDTVAIYKQSYSDTMMHTHKPEQKKEAQHMWRAMDNIEKEIEAIIGREG